MEKRTPGASDSTYDLLINKLWHGINPYAGVVVLPERVDTQGWSGSRHPWLEQAVEEIRPNIVIEIGVWKGASTLHMAEALRRSDVPGVIIAVDTWLGSSEHRTNADWFASLRVQNGQPTIQQTFMANVLSSGLQDYVLPLPLDSGNAAELVRAAGLSADLIHIDAGHDYRSVTADIEAWWPLLRPGGILIGNDYYANGAIWPEVQAAFDTFTSSRHLAFDHDRPKVRIRKPVDAPVVSSMLAANSWSDLHRSLPQTLEYTGEFGPELVLCLPFLNWLGKLGLLRSRKIITYTGMKCFYDDMGGLAIIEKAADREYVHPDRRASWLPVRNEHDFDGHGRSAQHLYPDLREKFRKLTLLPQVGSAGRPLLIVHNKYNDEWGDGPINYLPIESLRVIFELLGHCFTIVYIRHGNSDERLRFVGDHNVAIEFEDRGLLEAYPDVLCFDDLHAAHIAQGGVQDINTFKNVLYSRCHHFISSQGGGAHQIALYSGSLLAVLHRRGAEEQWAYRKGYYKFMATIPPNLVICRTEDDLLRALPLFDSSTVIEDRVYLNSGTLLKSTGDDLSIS
jgi:predicted O-methyltransferase YrrM